MRTFKGLTAIGLTVFVVGFSGVEASAQTQADYSRKTIWSALLGAGTGAIAAETSGGEAGTGALVGAGTQIIGSILFDLLATPSAPVATTVAAVPQPVYYEAPQPVRRVPVQTYQTQPQYQPLPQYQPVSQPVYYSSGQSMTDADNTRDILKKGLMGAATGAIAAEASDGEAGTGALVGAGTQIIGTALFDVLFEQPSQPAAVQPVAAYQPWWRTQPDDEPKEPTRKIVRTYDSDGKLISEEEFLL